MKLRDEERREGGVIGRSVRSSDQRDRRTEEKGERQREEEQEGAISSESMEGLHAMRIKGSTWPPTHCGRGGRGADATDPLTGKGRSDSGHAEMQKLAVQGGGSSTGNCSDEVQSHRVSALGTLQGLLLSAHSDRSGHSPLQSELCMRPNSQTARGISNEMC